MAEGDHINIRPHFKKEARLPCEGEAGDFYVCTRKFDEGQTDPEPFGSVELWFCTRGIEGERRAIWRRVQFEGYETCDAIPSNLPANPTELKQG